MLEQSNLSLDLSFVAFRNQMNLRRIQKKLRKEEATVEQILPVSKRTRGQEKKVRK